MAAVSILDTLEPQVAPTLRRAPRALLEQKARETLRDFCQITRCWQYRPAALNIVAAQASYTPATPGAYAEVIAVEYVLVSNPADSGGTPSTRRTTEWLDTNIPGWRTNSGDDVRYFAEEVPGTIIFSSKQVSAIVGGLTTRLSLKPTVTATQVDDSVTNEFLEEIAEGVKYRLHCMHGEAWTNEKAAVDELHRYTAGRSRARIKIHKRYGDPSNPMLSFTSPYRFA